MEKIYFLTGNEKKRREVGEILPFEVEQISLDLDEIQSLDQEAVLKHKLREAMQKCDKRPLMIEDVSLSLEAYDYTLPGPLIRWFLQGTPSQNHIYKMLPQGETRKARTSCCIGVAFEDEHIEFFTGHCQGQIADIPTDGTHFGFDPIFIPDGYTQTFAEMSREEKNKCSHRKKALDAFLYHLQSK